MAHWCHLAAALLTTLFVAVIIPLQANSESPGSYTTTSCFRKETYNTTSKVKVQIPVNKTRYDWCLGGFMRCMVYKVEMAEREINVTEIRSRMVEMCCPGTVPAPGTPSTSTNESLTCIPEHEASTSTPTTTTTTARTTPREVCKAGLWGRGCSHVCACGAGVPCDQDTGACGKAAVVNATTCSPANSACAPSAATPTEAATRPSTTSTTPATPTTPTSTPPPPPTTTTVKSTSTVATTPPTQSTPKPTTTTEKMTSPSTAPATQIPAVATTVSTLGPIARLTDSTTVRPIGIATRGWDAEHVTIERRKDVKSMAQPAKVTAQDIDPESVNRVDTSAGNGKPTPDTAPTNTSPVTAPPTSPRSTTTPKPPPTRPSSPTTTTPKPPPPTTTTPKPPSPTTTTPKPSSPTTTPKPPSSSTAPATTSSKPAPTTTSFDLRNLTQMTSTFTKPTLATPAPQTRSTSAAALDDNSSTDSESDEDTDDDDDAEDDEEDSDEERNFNTMREETILSPPNKPTTRIDHMETRINGSSQKMTWTFQTDFSVGPPIKLATPPPRKNAISPQDNRNSSSPYSDKISEDKTIAATTVTYGVKPWMPVLNLASSRPEEKTTRFVLSTLDKEILAGFTERTTAQALTQSPTYSTASTTLSSIPTTTLQTSTRKPSSVVTAWVTTENSTKTSFATSTSSTPQTETNISTSTFTPIPLDPQSGLFSLSTLLAGNVNTTVQTSALTSPSTSPSTTTSETRTVPTPSSTQATSPASTSTSIPAVSTTNTSPLFLTTTTLKPVLVSAPVPITASTFTFSNPTPTSIRAETPQSASPNPISILATSRIPSESPSISVNTVPSPVPTITPTSGLWENTTLQGHIAETLSGVLTSPMPGDVSLIGQSPATRGVAVTPNTPTVGSGAVGAAVAATAIALAILAILCVLIILARTRKEHSKRRPAGVAPPPSPPLISAWYSVPHYSETFTTPPPANRRPPVASAAPFREQFEAPAVEHVYQEITPLANVTVEHSGVPAPIPAPAPVRTPSTDPPRSPKRDSGPTKVLVRLRNLDEPVVR